MKRKLSLEKLRPNSIKTQIILGFGIILGLTLLIAIINLVALQVLQSNIEATIQEAGRVRGKREAGDLDELHVLLVTHRPVL